MLRWNACTRDSKKIWDVATSHRGPQLPIIPLGINYSTFDWRGRFNSRQEQRNHARQKLGLESSARVVLFLGRLSFHSKSHPLPLYRA